MAYSADHPLSGALERDFGSNMNDPAPVPTPDDLAKTWKKRIVPVETAARGGLIKNVLVLLDASGSMSVRSGVVKGILERIRAWAEREGLELIVQRFGDCMAFSEHATPMTITAAISGCPRIFGGRTNFAPHGANALSSHAGDVIGVIIVTDGAVNDPNVFIDTVAQSKMPQILEVIVDSYEAPCISRTLQKSVLNSPTYKVLHPILDYKSQNPEALTVLNEALDTFMRYRVPKHTGEKIQVGPLLLGRELSVADLTEGFTALLGAGVLSAAQLDELSEVVIRTLKGMETRENIRQMNENVAWFRPVHAALLRVHKLHARNYQGFCESDPAMVAEMRAAAMRKQFGDSVRELEAQCAPWRIICSRTPLAQEVDMALSSRDPWPLFQLLEKCNVRIAENASRREEPSPSAVRASIRPIFQSVERIIPEKTAVLIGAAVLASSIQIGDLRTTPRARGDIETMVHALAAETLNHLYGGDTLDPVMLSPSYLAPSLYMLQAVMANTPQPPPPAALRADRVLKRTACLRVARRVRIGYAQRLYTQLRRSEYEQRVDTKELKIGHLMGQMVLVELKPYDGDPFPEFPSLVLAVRVGWRKVACFYFEQPDCLPKSDAYTIDVDRFLDRVAACHGAIPIQPNFVRRMNALPSAQKGGSLPGMIWDVIEQEMPDVCARLERFRDQMRKLWVIAGGLADPIAACREKRALGVTSTGATRTGRLDPGGLTSADVKEMALESVRVLELTALKATARRCVIGPEEAAEAVCTLPWFAAVPEWALSCQERAKASGLATEFIAHGCEAVPPAWYVQPAEARAALPKELLDLAHQKYAAFFELGMTPEIVPECPICLEALESDQTVRPCTRSDLHALCLECYDRLVAAPGPLCPLCRAPLL